MRIEIGPKDIENDVCVLVRRDNRAKTEVRIEDTASAALALLDEEQKDMFERAKAFRDSHTYEAADYDTFAEISRTKPGFIKAFWCGDAACEEKIKADLSVTSRCMPMVGSEAPEDAVCICCGKKAKKLVYWGKAY